MTLDSPKNPPSDANSKAGNTPQPAVSKNDTVSLLGLARASTSGGGRFVPPTPEELSAALTQFEVEKLIGAGGMGAVYRVRQKGLDRIAALKVLPRELAERPGFQERFMREAKALAGLNHPHLVTVYEVGQDSGWCWLLMELVDGADLREVMSTGRLSPEQALKLVPQLCEALQYAHDRGVIHRDIKPENILIDAQGRLKLTDFGLAKILTKDDKENGATLTQTGNVLGTMHYMAPEQFEGAMVDHRADIYAVGVVLYEMLTGSLPIGRFQPPSRQLGVDVRIDEVVLKALDRDPEQRYQRADDVGNAVERASLGAQQPSAPAIKVMEPGNSHAIGTGKPQGWWTNGLRLPYGFILAISGIVVASASVPIACREKIHNFLLDRRHELGSGVPVSFEELSLELFSPNISSIFFLLLGLGMVAGGWALVSLRGRSLAVLGAVCALILPFFFYAPIYDAFDADDDLVFVIPVASLFVLSLLYFTCAAKHATSYDQAHHSNPCGIPGFAWATLFACILLCGVGFGAYAAVVKPIVEEETAKLRAGERTPMVSAGGRNYDTEYDYDFSQVAEGFDELSTLVGGLDSVALPLRTEIVSINNRGPSDSTFSLLDHEPIKRSVANLRDMSVGKIPKSFPADATSSSHMTWTMLVGQISQEGIISTKKCLRELESIKSSVAKLGESNNPDGAKSIPELEKRYSLVISQFTSLIHRPNALMFGTPNQKDFQEQRAIVLSVTPQLLADPKQEAEIRQKLLRRWYSPDQVDRLILVKRRVSPSSTVAIDWLREVLNTRTTTTSPVAFPQAIEKN